MTRLDIGDIVANRVGRTGVIIGGDDVMVCVAWDRVSRRGWFSRDTPRLSVIVPDVDR